MSRYKEIYYRIKSIKPSLCVSQEEFDRIIQIFSKYCPDKSITIVE